MAAGNGGSGAPFPRWQIAVAIGTASALGIGYWYLRQNSQKSKKGTLSSTKDSVSLDDSVQDDLTETTPLQRAQNLKNDGNNLFKKGKYDEAIALYNKAIEICPEDQISDLSTFYQNRAAAYEQLKKWSSVVTDCTKALELNPKYEKAIYRRARAYEAVKDWENCLDDLTALCLLQNFMQPNPIQKTDRVLKELGKQHALEALQNRKPVLPSKQFIKTYFMSFPSDPVYQKLMNTQEVLGTDELKGFARAKLAFATENYEDVIPACTEEINYSEAESQYIIEALSLRGSFHLLSGAHTEALEDFRVILEDMPDADVKIKVNVLIKRASLYLQTEEKDKCLQDFTTAAELGPRVSDVYHHRGQVFLLLERGPESRNDFNMAAELNPEFTIALIQKYYSDYRYAKTENDADLYMKSMQNFRNAMQKFPNLSEVYILFAQILMENEEYEEAEKLYVKASEIDPNNATILVHRGVLQLQWRSNIDDAIELIKTAIKIDDKCEFAYETLGIIEVQRGNLLLAIDLFDRGIKLARTLPELTHFFQFRDAASSQLRVSTKLDIGPLLLNT